MGNCIEVHKPTNMKRQPDDIEKQLVKEGHNARLLEGAENHDRISLLDGHWNVLEQV